MATEALAAWAEGAGCESEGADGFGPGGGCEGRLEGLPAGGKAEGSLSSERTVASPNAARTSASMRRELSAAHSPSSSWAGVEADFRPPLECDGTPDELR